MQYLRLIAFGFVFTLGSANAESIDITFNKVTSRGVGKEIGTINVADSEFGAVFSPNLNELSPGIHGFHIHQNPDCGAKEKEGKMIPGLAAGGHYDPGSANFHSGPYGKGHLGDLSFLFVDATGKASYPLLAPRVKVADLKGRSLVIHASGDNYSDIPKKLGGGGSRMACAVIN